MRDFITNKMQQPVGRAFLRRSSKEAGMCILGYQCRKFLHGFDFRFWLEAMPLEVATLPEHAPDTTRSDIGCLRHRQLVFLVGRSPPDRSDLENFNALPGNTEP